MAIYNYPFYNLSPNESKLLIPLLAITQNQQFVVAGGIVPLTLENYLNTIKAAYSNCIVIQNILVSHL